MKQVGFVIPVYRNVFSLEETYSRIQNAVTTAFSDVTPCFMFVNDGSDDGSLEKLKELHATNNNVYVVDLSRNFGQVPAIIAGLRTIKTDAVIVVSADLQDPVEVIVQMIEQWKHGNEIIIAHRMSREDALTASLPSKFFYALIKFSTPKMPYGGFDFFLVDKKAYTELAALREHNRFIQGDVLWLGFKTIFLPYHRVKREHGQSQWSFFKKLKYFIDGFLSTSYLSIRAMSCLGVLTASAGFVYAFVIIFLKLVYDISPEGIAPIMVLLLTIGGVIMIMLGIIGEYIWRIYDETRDRPLYIVKDVYSK